MLISFTIENWMSFREPATLSMVASRERQHSERLPHVPGQGMRLLPVAAVYGANASGKSNLFAALAFAQQLVVKGTPPGARIPVKPFRLSSACENSPTRFSFELVIGDACYAFSFGVTRDRVVEERLVEVRRSSERELYHRDQAGIAGPAIDEDKRTAFVAEGTRDSQLFLTNAVDQKIERFKPLYDWFREELTLIFPDSEFEPFFDITGDTWLYKRIAECLDRLDTGVCGLERQEVDQSAMDLSQELMHRLTDALQDVNAVVRSPGGGHIFLEDGQFKMRRIVTVHKAREGRNVRFPIDDESDGTRRAMDLLPAFLDLAGPTSAKVYVVDELDRSLHTLLIRSLLESYLNACSADARGQLLFTTHDVCLMDQRLLRRDEMWVTERNRYGESSLLSFADYKDVRKDKDIRKSYLQGRLGGIPRILLSDALTTVGTRGEDDG